MLILMRMSHRSRVPLVIVLTALTLSIVEAAGIYARSMGSGYPNHPWLALRTGLALWLTMAAVTPLPVWMARRFPFDRGTLVPRVALHLVAAVAFVTLHLLLDIGVQTLQGNMRPEPLGPHLADLLSHYLAIEMIVYAAVAGAIMFLQARRESEARAIAAERLRAQLSEARLAALRMQLAPHFIFNTLNAISTLALRGDVAATCKSLALLSDMMRSVLDAAPRTEVPLSDELAFIGLYLELQKLRFENRLVVHWDIEAGARDALVPQLLLQPIVENAIRHGLDTVRGGEVRLLACRENGHLRLEITDHALETRLPEAASEASTGVGLHNTRERLATLYGEAQSLELEIHPSGSAVRIRLPLRSRAGTHAS
jgi:two-component system, LytTR family, sensor kinase